MKPLSWALKEVDLVGLHRQSGIHARGGFRGGGGAHPARNTPKIFAPPFAIGKDMIFGVKS